MNRKKLNQILTLIEERKYKIRKRENEYYQNLFEMDYIWNFSSKYASDFILNKLYENAELCINRVDYMKELFTITEELE